MTQTVIESGAPLVTLINVFTVEPPLQQQLLDILAHATEEVVQHQPGFISANLHASLDGTQVTNYAQWASTEDMQQMLANEECQPHLRAASALASAVVPQVYRVASVHHR
ncbi:MAG: antibiotic biosynthesis monooxygenase family protein [Propionibacteriaceae bacterium]